MLAAARKQATSKEILLWMTPSEAPKALQASECSELLDPMGASCWISAQPYESGALFHNCGTAWHARQRKVEGQELRS